MILSLCLVYIFSSLLIGLAWQQVNSRIDRDYKAELQLVWRESYSLIRAFEGFARSIFRNTETGLQMWQLRSRTSGLLLILSGYTKCSPVKLAGQSQNQRL